MVQRGWRLFHFKTCKLQVVTFKCRIFARKILKLKWTRGSLPTAWGKYLEIHIFKKYFIFSYEVDPAETAEIRFSEKFYRNWPNFKQRVKILPSWPRDRFWWYPRSFSKILERLNFFRQSLWKFWLSIDDFEGIFKKWRSWWKSDGPVCLCRKFWFGIFESVL